LLAEYGRNRLPEPPLPGPVAVFLRQFRSPFIYILLVAALASLALGQRANAVFILAVLLLNAVIGSIQEFSAQRSAAALRSLVRGEARVIRDGRAQSVDVEELVPGDLVLLSSGDRVPADLHLAASHSLTVDESMLTGESLAVDKAARPAVPVSAPIAERSDHCFAGTIVIRGRGRGRVVATALATQIGHIAERVSAERISAPPLMLRIGRFTYQVAGAIFVAILLLVGMMAIRGGYDATGMAMMAIGLAVSTIPEGLPAALTVALAIGMQRMAKLGVIIRRLVAVEALGSCTFICSDKTGTLTVNELTIREVLMPDGTGVRVTGEGVAPGGEVVGSDGDHRDRLEQLCTTGLLANESNLDYAGGEWVGTGDIVDVAFLVLAKKLGLSLSDARGRRERLDLIPYESERAFSGSVNDVDGDGATLFIKGSPEKLLAMSEFMLGHEGVEEIDRARIERQFVSLAEQGYRVIALGYRHWDGALGTDAIGGVTFLGMVAMIDPVRSDVKPALEACRAGGIGVAMVTGDHPATARAIALELELCEAGDPVVTGAMMREVEGTSGDAEARLDDLIRGARVFARIEPAQKERIVDAFMRDGHFVAVTGDGVNDAPAMRRANAGIAMGRRGTDVARESADLIITDDRFASIVNGIEQGRIVYANIRKVIALLITTGFSALLLFFLVVVAGLPMPLTAVQLLWLNLVANGLQDVALAFEPAEGGELDRRPRSPTEPILDGHLLQHVFWVGGVMGVLAFATFGWLIGTGYGETEARCLTLMLMVLFGNIHALQARSETRSLLHIRFFANPFLVAAVPFAQLLHIGASYTPGLSDVLELTPVTLAQWSLLAAIALLLLVAEEGQKWMLRRAVAKDAVVGG
jgi:magnesium-transporting ATPase (P-type)